MINEEVGNKSVEVGVRITNLSLDLILKALGYLTKKLEGKPDAQKANIPATKDGEAPKPELKEGKQTLKELHKHNEGLSTIELKDPNLRDLYKEMKKNDIDFSVVKDGKGKYTLFFKGKNAEEMTNAFKKYTEKTVAKADIKAEKTATRNDKKAERAANRSEKKSIKAELKQAKKEAAALNAGREKNKSKGARGR